MSRNAYLENENKDLVGQAEIPKPKKTSREEVKKSSRVLRSSALRQTTRFRV